MIVAFILAMSWLAAAFGLLVGSPEAATGATFVLMFIPYLSHRVRPRPHAAGGAAPDRRQPAVHAGDRDHARAVDGPHLDRRQRRPRGAAGRPSTAPAILVVSFVCASRLYTRRTAA